MTIGTIREQWVAGQRQALLADIAACFGPDEEQLDTEVLCTRLNEYGDHRERYDDDWDPEWDKDGWTPHSLARVLRRLGMFDLWEAPYDGSVIGCIGSYDLTSDYGGAPAAGDPPDRTNGGGYRVTTDDGDQVHIYDVGTINVQICSSSCAAAAAEVIAVFEPDEVDLLIAGLTAVKAERHHPPDAA